MHSQTLFGMIPPMTHLPDLISDLAVLLATASVVTLICKRLKQPLVLGYLIAGILVGPHFSLIPTITDPAAISLWGEIGVIILLFALGLEFSFRRLAQSGTSAVTTGVLEIVFMIALGYLIGRALGWSEMDGLFLGGILSISSTTIIVKCFDELGQKGRSYVPLVLSVLIVEDLIAILLLVLLSTVALTKTFSGGELFMTSLRLGFFLILWMVVGTMILPALIRRIRKDLADETALVVGLGLCLTMVVLATKAGFSPALGAFVMGSLLSETLLGPRIEKLIHPVKDLFGAVFFVSVGMLLDPEVLKNNWGVIGLISIATIFGKTFSTVLGALISREPLQKSVQAGLSLAQIGEFSFIIAGLGARLKVTGDQLPPIAVAVSAITTFTTPWLIRSSGPWAEKLETRLPVKFRNYLERRQHQRVQKSSGLNEILKAYLPRLAVHSTLIVAIAWSAHIWAWPVCLEAFGETLASILCLLGIFILSAPFYWGLLVSHPSHVPAAKNKGLHISLALVRIIFGSGLVAFCLSLFLPAMSATWLLLGVLILGLIVFLRWGEYFYRSFESGLRENLQQAPETHSHPPLAPWDASLSEFTISPLSEVAGKTLMSSTLKERFGVMVALIERGTKQILAPGRDTLLLPGDKIYLIGTDKQISQVAPILEKEMPFDDFDKKNYGLESVVLQSESPYLGQSIRDCGLREKIHGLIVGIERGGARLLNPDSTLILKPDDLLWVVGDLSLIKELAKGP